MKFSWILCVISAPRQTYYVAIWTSG